MPPRRRRKSTDGDRRPEKKPRKDEVYSVDCLFCELLEKNGFIISSGEGKNEIKVDQTVLQRGLTSSLKQLGRLDEAVSEFLDGFSNCIEEPSRFHKSLMPTSTTDCETARSALQESLVRILLGIDIVQPKLINILLEKLPEFMGEEDDVLVQGEKINVPKLLLNQFRWLGRIISSKDLTKKLLEMIPVTSLDVQKEIISALPEVVEDSEHGEVASTLKKLLLEGNQLTVVILDTLSNLNLSKKILSEVQTSALRTLKSVDLEDLPVVVNFLMQTVSPQDAQEVVSELRANLDFETFISTSTKASKKLTGSSNSVVDCKVLTLDAIKSGICSKKSVAEAWIKAIEAVKTTKDHKVVDILVLFILHTVNRKATESLFRNKIRAGAFSEALLRSSLGSHTQMLREYFPVILSLAEVFLRSPEQAITYFACSMYRNTFLASDPFCRQEVVGSIVTHANSGLEGEVDAALDVLTELVGKHLSSMAPYTVFIKGILDCLDKLSIMQIRKLYSILSRLAFQQPEHGSAVQDDLFIIIRKQLSINSPKYRRMGVIGAIMVVQGIACAEGQGAGDADGASGSGGKAATRLSEEMYKQVISLLQMVHSSSSHVPEAAALFMDELSAVVSQGQLHPQVLQWISDNMINDFQEEFVVDVEEGQNPECPLLPIALLYNLNDADSSIAINLLPLVAQSIQKKSKLLPLGRGRSEKITDPTYLAPLFRLVQVCEYQQNKGDLEGIDALLGCPVYTVDENVLDKVESLSQKEKEAACTVLFHLLNWFREVVNAFASQEDVEMKGKIMMRLQNITSLQTMLEKCLATVPNFCPPSANFDLDSVLKAPVPSTSGSSGGEKKKGRKQRKKKKENSDPTQGEDDHDDDSTSHLEKGSQKQNDVSTQQSLDSSEAKETATTVTLASYQQFLRELDVGVFTILSSGMITKADLDTNMNTKATEELGIQPPQLKFLLDDLARKTAHSLLATASKRRTFLKTKTEKNVGFSHLDQLTPAGFASKVVDLLPSLCDHLEKTSAFFQALAVRNDGLIDGPGSHSPEAEMIGSCFLQLLQILHSLFSWNGFSASENLPQLKKALSVLVQRIKLTESSQWSLQELLRGAFQYLQNFSSTCPSLATAVVLVKLLTCLQEKLGADDRDKLASLAEEFLKREWIAPDGEKPRRAKHNESLYTIIKTFVVSSEDPMTAMETLALKAIPELLDAGKDGCSDTYPTLTRPAFVVFYRVLFTELVEAVKGIQVGRKKESSDLKLDKLLRWSTAVRILHALVNLIKSFDAHTHLACCLKYGRQFLEVFLRQGMPLLDEIFRSHQNDVHGLLRNMQLSTRGFHHMCGHSKIVRDTVLMNQVPQLKRVLEMLVYRVRAMLTVNRCLEAFWMGNLKNRDLHGEEILSQTTATSQEASSEEEEEGTLADSDESEVEMDNQSEVGDNGEEDNVHGDGESLSQAY